MSRFTLMENLPDLLIASTTTVTMASSFLGKPTRITVGGSQLLYTSLTTLNFATTGLNALDTGTIALNSLYYIYSVKSSGGVAGLVASLAAPAVGPSGYTAWREIGRCRTLSSAATLATITNRVGGTSSLTLGGSEWVSYTFTLVGVTGGTPSNTTGYWRRVESEMQIRIGFSTSGTGSGSTIVTTTTPTGFTITASAFPSGVLSNSRNYVGTATFYNGTSFNECGISIDSGTTLRFLKTGGSAYLVGSDFPSTAEFSFLASAPIAEWVGLYT